MEQLTEQIKNEIGQLHGEMLSTIKQYKDETVANNGKLLTDAQEKFDKMNKRMDELEVAYLRPQKQMTASDIKTEESEKRKAAYDCVLRKGYNDAPTETKTLIEADATTGGFLTIPDYVNEIIKGIVLISPVRAYAKVRTTNRDSVKQPTRTATGVANWGVEALQQTEMTGPAYGQAEVPVRIMTAMKEISNEDIEDSLFDLPAELNEEFTEQFAKAEGAGFLNGAGNMQPEGIMVNPAVAADNTGSASALTYSGFVNCSHNLKSGYAANAAWFLNRQSIGATRQLVDGQNRPIWLPWAQAGLDSKNPPTILGLPYAEMPDMPNVGAGTYPVVLGDWKRCYLVVDRLAISVVRDNISKQDRGVVRFIARRRVGGKVILTEGIRKMLVSA